MSNTPTRRGLLKMGLGATVAAAVTPTLASAETTNASRIQDFYYSITQTAFEATYGDRLAGATNNDEVAAVLSGSREAYQENLIVAAENYFRDLSADDSAELYSRLTSSPDRVGGFERSLISAFREDVISYQRNRAPYGDNPIFSTLQNLADNEIVSQEDVVTRDGVENPGWINIIQGVIDIDFSQALNERVEAVINAAPATVPVPAAPVKDF